LDVEPIPCELLDLREWEGILAYDSEEERRKGRYHGSFFHNVDEFGVKKWVVGGYILVDWEELREKGSTPEEIVQGCLKFLNQPPPRKKFQRRRRKPLYGNLDQIPVRFKLREKKEKSCIEILFVTDKRKCKQFWGEGIKI
tara:strand:+ start:174 stop:596 length:423 start_codon:yes stop_codon:yes gene_type:complete